MTGACQTINTRADGHLEITPAASTRGTQQPQLHPLVRPTSTTCPTTSTAFPLELVPTSAPCSTSTTASPASPLHITCTTSSTSHTQANTGPLTAPKCGHEWEAHGDVRYPPARAAHGSDPSIRAGPRYQLALWAAGAGEKEPPVCRVTATSQSHQRAQIGTTSLSELRRISEARGIDYTAVDAALPELTLHFSVFLNICI